MGLGYLSCTLLLCLLALCAATTAARADAPVSDLFMYVEMHTPSCFVDSLASGVTMIIAYAHPEADSKGLKLVLTSPEGDVVLVENVERNKRVAYAAPVAGEYKLCVTARDAHDFGKPWPASGSRVTKFHLKIDVLASDNPAAAIEPGAAVASQKHVLSLEEELTKMSRDVDVLVRDLELAKSREAHFREQSERINAYVVWVTILQAFSLAAVGIFQASHLRNFFKEKKLA